MMPGALSPSIGTLPPARPPPAALPPGRSRFAAPRRAGRTLSFRPRRRYNGGPGALNRGPESHKKKGCACERIRFFDSIHCPASP